MGYIDSPTRLTLRTLLPLEAADFPAASGADDDQLPALAALPPLVGTHTGSLRDLLIKVEDVVRVTNNHDLAVAAAQSASAALFNLLQGAPVAQALEDALPLCRKHARTAAGRGTGTGKAGQRCSRGTLRSRLPCCRRTSCHLPHHAASTWLPQCHRVEYPCRRDSCGRGIMWERSRQRLRPCGKLPSRYRWRGLRDTESSSLLPMHAPYFEIPGMLARCLISSSCKT